MRHVRSRASQESGRMVTSAIRLWTAATFEVAKRKIPGASRFRVSTAARQARRAWSRFAADATAWSTSRSTSGLSRSEERRVGKECTARSSAQHQSKKEAQYTENVRRHMNQ